MFRNYSKALHLNFAVGVSSAVFVAFLLAGCEEEKPAPVVREVRRIKGEVEVLNSCSMKGAAVKMRTFLRDNGFDVVHIDNERLQNYDETIIVLRNPEWEGAKALAQTLQTKKVLTIVSKRAYVDAAVYIGKDFHKIIEPEQGETDDNE
jgi:hypothetical protein